MKKIAYVRILEIRPGTLDEGNEEHIIDAYIKVKADQFEFWCFVPDWRKYFPYSRNRHHSYGVGKELKRNLLGKVSPVEFSFLNVPVDETKVSVRKIKTLVPVTYQKKPCDYTLFGEIVDIASNVSDPKKENILVDCGVIVGGIIADKSKFHIGEYLQAEGRLDAHLVENNEK